MDHLNLTDRHQLDTKIASIQLEIRDTNDRLKTALIEVSNARTSHEEEERQLREQANRHGNQDKLKADLAENDNYLNLIKQNHEAFIDNMTCQLEIKQHQLRQSISELETIHNRFNG